MAAARNIVPVTCVAVLLLSLSACAAAPRGAGEKAVEKVNGAVITKAQLDRAVKALVAQKAGGQTLTPDQMRKASEAALARLTDEELLYQEGAKLEIKDLDQLVAEKFARNRASFPDEATFRKALQAFQMTPEEMQQTMRKEVVVDHLLITLFVSQATVSEADAKKFYDDNLDKLFRKGERVKASHILVSVDAKAPAAERAQAKQKAEALLKRVRGGEDFAAVAKAESNCPSGARGGELGVFGKGQMPAPFDKVAFTLKPDELSPVVESEFGYHLIKVSEKLPPATDRFEEVKGKIVDFLKRDRVKKAVTAYLAQLRGKASIEKS